MSHSTLSQIALQEKTRREILHKSDLIPPLPDLVARLLGILNRQETEPRDLEALLQNDQVLVAKMLAMVNSPFYGLNRTIRTIKEAVMVLGFRGVRSLVLATSTAKFLQRDYACYGHEPKGLWLHAVCVASASRALARRCSLTPDQAEQLFVAGLLHDIGKLLLVPYFSDALAGRQLTGPAAPLEQQLIGLDHAEAGGLVTAKWGLAPEVQEIIRSHHAPAAADGLLITAIVRIADSLAHEFGRGYLSGRAPEGVVAMQDVAIVGIAAEAWPEVRDDLVQNMEEAVMALGNLTA